jgi:hypothetical protein
VPERDHAVTRTFILVEPGSRTASGVSIGVAATPGLTRGSCRAYPDPEQHLGFP